VSEFMGSKRYGTVSDLTAYLVLLHFNTFQSSMRLTITAQNTVLARRNR